MPVANVLRLQEYRDRRSARLRLTQAFHRADPRRGAVLSHLVDIAELAGADRAAAVWVDEHGTGLIHPYVVVDQLNGRPRRTFAREPLRSAWQLGVPSAFDQPAEPGTTIPSTFAVALGSDGARAWFVVADSVTARPPVPREIKDRIMFFAGECAAVVLHRDLDAEAVAEPVGIGAPRFAGWDVLADLEGRESDEADSRRIAQRFVVIRLIRMLVDDELTVAGDRSAEQVKRARAELADDAAAGTEGELWQRTLSALEDEGFEDLATVLVELGDHVEAQGHMNGAREIYRCAYEIAAAIGAPRPAAEAARLTGRLVRRQADWAGARQWFDVAREIADVAELHDVATHVLVGLAGITRETGNLPAARSGFHDALAVAKRSGDPDALGAVHHALLGLEQQAGDLPAALGHGWLAMAAYRCETRKLRCMAGLAGALMEYGDREAAEDAWTVVAASSSEQYYRVYAHDALAHLSALRGDRAQFEAQAGKCDALGWETGTSSAKAEILYYRGLSYAALSELERAREWLRRAMEFAEGHGYNRAYFKAEEALERLSSPDAAEPAQTPAAPTELREGLRAMRRELVASPA